jgi:hypothetical protein
MCKSYSELKWRQSAPRDLDATETGTYSFGGEPMEKDWLWSVPRQRPTNFDGHGQVLNKGLHATQRFALGAVFVYQLALWYRFEKGS